MFLEMFSEKLLVLFLIFCLAGIIVGLVSGKRQIKKQERLNNLCESRIPEKCCKERKYVVVSMNPVINYEMSISFYCKYHKDQFLAENVTKEKYDDYVIRSLDGSDVNEYNDEDDDDDE